MQQCRAWCSWSYRRLNSRDPRVAAGNRNTSNTPRIRGHIWGKTSSSREAAVWFESHWSRPSRPSPPSGPVGAAGGPCRCPVDRFWWREHAVVSSPLQLEATPSPPSRGVCFPHLQQEQSTVSEAVCSHRVFNASPRLSHRRGRLLYLRRGPPAVRWLRVVWRRVSRSPSPRRDRKDPRHGPRLLSWPSLRTT